MKALEKLLNRYSSKIEGLNLDIEMIKAQINAPGGVESEEEAEYIGKKYEIALISKEAEMEVLKRIVSDLKMEIEGVSDDENEETEYSND